MSNEATLGEGPGFNGGCGSSIYYNWSPQTETTVVEVEEFDADGKLTKRTKTTTTRYINNQYYNPIRY